MPAIMPIPLSLRASPLGETSDTLGNDDATGRTLPARDATASPDLVACLALEMIRAALLGEPAPDAVEEALAESPELARAVRRRALEALETAIDALRSAGAER